MNKVKNWYSIFQHPIFLFIGFVIMAVYLIEFYPRYILLPIHSPDYYQEGFFSDWDKTTYSIYTAPFLAYTDIARFYVLRKESSVTAKNASIDSITSYFNAKLDGLGWVRDNTYVPCREYLPEARLLVGGKDYIDYHKKDYGPMPFFDTVSLTCLAIWKESGFYEGSYRVILITVNPSFITTLESLF